MYHLLGFMLLSAHVLHPQRLFFTWGIWISLEGLVISIARETLLQEGPLRERDFIPRKILLRERPHSEEDSIARDWLYCKRQTPLQERDKVKLETWKNALGNDGAYIGDKNPSMELRGVRVETSSLVWDF